MRKFLRWLFPKHTARGRRVRGAFNRVMSVRIMAWIRTRRRAKKMLVIDKYVAPLLNPDVLMSKIAHVEAMVNANDAKKEFYVINWAYADKTSAGLCAQITVHFCGIVYALAYGKIPVIDMQNNASQYLEKEKLGKENAWEYYFKQPFGCGLESLRQGKAQVHNGDGIFGYHSLPRTLVGSEPNYDACFQTWTTIYKQCFHLNDATQKHVDEEYSKLIKPGMRVLGVNCRGADYNPAMAAGHPIQPDIDTLIAKVEIAMEEWKCDYIFLATPEKKSIDVFNNHFPGKVLFNNVQFYDRGNTDFTKQYVGSIKNERPNDAYLKGLEYLTTIIILSRCTSAVLGQTAGSMVARYINDRKYENVYVFDLGRYSA